MEATPPAVIPPPHRGRSTLLGALALLAAFAFLYNAVRMRVDERNDLDFAHYWLYSGLMLEGVNGYDLAASEREALKRAAQLPVPVAGKPEYSPLLFALFTPLALLPFPVASWLWFGGQLVAALLLWLVLLRLFGERLGREGPAIVALLLALSWPLQVEVDTGNINLWLACGAALAALALLRRGRWGIAGEAVAALMILAKPQYSLLLLLLVPRRQWASLLRAVGFYLLGRLAGVLVYGWEVELAFWANLLGNVAGDYLTANTLNISLAGTLSRIFAPAGMEGLARGLSAGAALALVAGLAWRLGLDREGDPREHAALVSGVLLVASPLVYAIHHVLAPLLLLELGTRLPATRRHGLLFAAALVLVQLRLSFERFAVTAEGPLALLRSLPLVGVALALLLLWRLRPLPLLPGKPGRRSPG